MINVSDRSVSSYLFYCSRSLTAICELCSGYDNSVFGDICKTEFAVETPLRDCGLHPQKSNQRQFISLETANYAEQAPHTIYEAQRTVSTRSHHTLGWLKAFRACADDYLAASRSVKLDFQADEHDH